MSLSEGPPRPVAIENYTFFLRAHSNEASSDTVAFRFEEIFNNDSRLVPLGNRLVVELPGLCQTIRSPKPTDPILQVCGYGCALLGSDPKLIVQTVAIDNVQILTATIAVNVMAELWFNHPTRGKRKVVPYAWISREVAGQSFTTHANPIDIASGERFNVPYVYKSPHRDRISFPTEKDSAVYREFEQGVWKVLISVTADNCQMVRCGVAFEVRADGTLGRQKLITSYLGDFNQWLVSYGSEFGY